MLTTPEQIERYRLVTLRAAVRLESVGMKRKGKSAAAISRELLGLSRSAPFPAVIAGLNQLIEETHVETV
jgi:hypothetical protein